MPLMKFLGRKTVKAEKTSAPMVKASKSGKAVGVAVTGRKAPTHDEIAARSYELYLARGGESGHAEEDWLRAEAELSGL
jgi:Protein of unknown function (DUF2934)